MSWEGSFWSRSAVKISISDWISILVLVNNCTACIDLRRIEFGRYWRVWTIHGYSREEQEQGIDEKENVCQRTVPQLYAWPSFGHEKQRSPDLKDGRNKPIPSRYRWLVVMHKDLLEKGQDEG